jgi:hypothetical protein
MASSLPYVVGCDHTTNLEERMANDARQNPSNKWGRYSGGGPAGVSEVIPTEAEARRGLQPFSTGGGEPVPRTLALGLTALVGALLAGAAVWRARQPKDLRTRMLRRAGIR